jgi:tetratricopeptide (TPR) repeat protein
MRSLPVVLLACTCALAQMHDHGPSAREPAVDLTKLPEPQRIEGIGHSHITITTKWAEAQQWFDQGLALLHCFWDYEALRAFEQSVRLDPNCAMCHWGLSRALAFQAGTDEQVKQELARAKELAPKTSDHEQRYVRAYVDSQDKEGDEGGREFDTTMEALIDRYPDDIEAKLQLALHANGGYDHKGDPRSGALYAQTLLKNILRDQPDNAAANHYWIHAMEGSGHPEWALESAEKLGKLAPGSGHMVHMPGHIFYRLGDYGRARQVFLASLRVDQGYMAKQHVPVRNDWNFAHNISYLIADCAEEGRYTEAREHARSLEGLANDPDRSVSPWRDVFQIGSAEARLAIRFANWDDAIEHPMEFGVPDEKVSVWARAYRDGLIAYARGMKAAETDQLSEGEEDSIRLDALLWRLSQEQITDRDKAGRERVLKILGTASLELRGNLASHKGEYEEARRLLEGADRKEVEIGYAEPPQYSRPAMEVLGSACIRAGKFDEARGAFRKALSERPHSGFALYGIALSWDKQGKSEEAVRAYREFLDAWAHADRDLPPVKAAEAVVARRGL